MKCEYGCGNEATYQLKNGKWICSEKSSQCPVVRRKNSESLIIAHKNGKFDDADFHKPNWSKNLTRFTDSRLNGKYTNNVEDYLSNKYPIKTTSLKNILFDLNILEKKCSICGITDWNNKPITFELHHKDGNSKNNNLDNLEILCPNCHSQTDNFRSKNHSSKGNWKNAIDEKEFVEILKNSKSIAMAIKTYNQKFSVSLPLAGPFYGYVKNIMHRYSIMLGETLIHESLNNIAPLENDLKKMEKDLLKREIESYKQRILDDRIKRNLEAKKLLLDANINYSKIGWVTAAAKITGISRNNIREWIKQNCPEINIEEAFDRRVNNC